MTVLTPFSGTTVSSPFSLSSRPAPKPRVNFGMALAKVADTDKTAYELFKDALGEYDSPREMPLWMPFADIDARLDRLPGRQEFSGGLRSTMNRLERQILKQMQQQKKKVDRIQALPGKVTAFVHDAQGDVETLREQISRLENPRDLTTDQLLEAFGSVAEQSTALGKRTEAIAQEFTQTQVAEPRFQTTPSSAVYRLDDLSRRIQQQATDFENTCKDSRRHWVEEATRRLTPAQLQTFLSSAQHLGGNVPDSIQPQINSLKDALNTLWGMRHNLGENGENLLEQAGRIENLALAIAAGLRTHGDSLPATTTETKAWGLISSTVPNPEKGKMKQNEQIFTGIAQFAQQLTLPFRNETTRFLDSPSGDALKDVIAEYDKAIDDVALIVQKLEQDQDGILSSVEYAASDVLRHNQHDLTDLNLDKSYGPFSVQCADLAKEAPDIWRKPDIQKEVQRVVETLLAQLPSSIKINMVRHILEKYQSSPLDMPPELATAWVKAALKSTELQNPDKPLRVNGIRLDSAA